MEKWQKKMAILAVLKVIMQLKKTSHQRSIVILIIQLLNHFFILYSHFLDCLDYDCLLLRFYDDKNGKFAKFWLNSQKFMMILS